jgi:SAM-dependent methyltransferase
MNPQSMKPFGMAIDAYFEGDKAVELIMRRDDGQQFPVPVGVFFRDPSKFSAIDQAAVELCTGRVLDVGAGTGVHGLVLQEKDLPVTCIDISPHAVNIMERRGLKDVHCADIFEFTEGPFDTLLMMGHGIGLVETIDGMDRFLERAHTLLTEDGQVLLDSLDVRVTDDPDNLAYHEANRRKGRYIGEIGIQFEFRGEKGPYCGWLQVDEETLSEHAETAGYRYELIHKEESGDHLSRLIKHKS